jgi:peptidoglycan/xylan/chitin deacetylase (PgdA/CDA1 family)
LAGPQKSAVLWLSEVGADLQLSGCSMKEILLKSARAVGGFALARRAMRGHLRILAYHGIWTTPGFQYGDRLFITAGQFERRMTWLKHSGYPVIPLDHAVEALARQRLPSNAVVITIDDGWKSTYSHMLPVLHSLGLPATVYVTTWYVDNRAPVLNVALNYVLQRSGVRGFTWRRPDTGSLDVKLEESECRSRAASALYDELEQLSPFSERLRAFEEICRLAEVPTEPWWSGGQFHLMTRQEITGAFAQGFDIQLHTHTHRQVDVNTDELPGELYKNRSVLSDICKTQNLSHFCYPSGVVDAKAVGILAQCGIKSATTCYPGLNAPEANPYGLRRFLDGRSVTDAEFEAYLSGTLEIFYSARARVRPNAWPYN